MAQGSLECPAYSCIPDVYVQEASTESRYRRDCGRQQHAGPDDWSGLTRKEHAGTEGDADVDLVKKGFIPYNELKLEHLHPDIRTEENLERILKVGERVVRIISYRMSDQRNENEEMKKPGSSQKGSGFAFSSFPRSGERFMLLTNQHVLYNEEEVEQSVVDFFFDSYGARSQSRKMERTKQGSGTLILRQNSRSDFCVIVYDLDPKSEVALDFVNPFSMTLLNLLPQKRDKVGKEQAESDRMDRVCVISHPLGRSKHVSFGKIVEWNLKENKFLYDAPTEPGSSGAPIVIFTQASSLVPEECLFYHEGTNKHTGLKVGHVENINVLLPKIPIDYQQSLLASRRRMIEFIKQRKSHFKTLSLEDVRREAQLNVFSSRLAAFVPIFSAFVLQPKKYSSSMRSQPQDRPCEKLSQADIQLTKDDETYLASWFPSVFEHYPSAFQNLSEPDEGEAPSLSALLTSGALCWCQVIVDAVVQHTASENEDSSDRFLRPDAVYGEFVPHKTWPWSRDASRGGLGPEREPLRKDCLLKECLNVLPKTRPHRQVSLSLLALIREANKLFSQSLFEACRITENSDSCEKSETRCSSDVFEFLHEIAPKMPAVSFWVHFTEIDLLKSVLKPEYSDGDCVASFYSTLDLIAHVKAHCIRDHPDHAPSEGDFSPQLDCPCGRPSWGEVAVASLYVSLAGNETFHSKRSAHREEHRNPQSPPTCEEPFVTFTENPTDIDPLLSLLMKVQVECSSPRPLEEYLTRIDALHNFKTSCDLFSVAVTSQEVFLFNCRQLLRQCHQLVSPCYISGPISVFGRPGRWPAGVTPVAVKKTAWRLIQAACGKTLFGRCFLEVLEQDADRREKLIDWYVDMKQLKFAGNIEVKAMDEKCMRRCRLLNEHVKKGGWPQFLSDNPTHFVMRTFVALVEPFLLPVRSLRGKYR